MALTQIKTTGIADNAVTDAKVVDAITSSNHLPLAGGTMTGVLNMNSQNITNAGTIQGTLSTASQTNITSVGTLSSLNVSGNAVISGTLQSDDFTLDAGSGNPDLVIKTTASSSATAQMLFLTGSHDFTLINDTANFRLYNSTPTIGVDVIKVIGSSSDILFGDVGNSRHLSLDYSSGDVVVNGGGLGVGAVPRQYYKLDVYNNGNSTIFGLRSESHGCTQYFQTGNTLTGQLEFTTSQGWLTTRTASPLKLGINNAVKLTIGADGNTTFAGNLTIPEFIYHSGDTDTFIRFTDNKINFVSGNSTALELGGTGSGNTFRGTNTFEGQLTVDTGGTSIITADGNNSSGDDGRIILKGHTAGQSRAYAYFNNGVTSGGLNWYVGNLRGSNRFTITCGNDDHPSYGSGSYNDTVIDIDSNRKVGIGCSPTGVKLAVDSHAGSDIVNFSNNSNSTGITIGYTTNLGSIDLGSSQALRIRQGGSTPLYINTNGVIDGNFNHTSDRALKKDIKDLEKTLEAVNKIKPSTFKWKEETKSDKKQIGFIAQDVEKYFPELVHGEEGTKSINTLGVVSILMKAVQELSAKVTELNDRCNCECC